MPREGGKVGGGRKEKALRASTMNTEPIAGATV